jgi:ABC-type taurine transport system ATPase subunit
MKAVKAIYENGRIKLAEKPVAAGPVEVLVVFPEQADDPWAAIVNDPTPRPALAKWIKEVKREIAQGKAKPLRLDDL